jgi:hypothetical protein
MARASVSARSTEELLGEVGSFELWVFIGREFDDVHLYLKGEAIHDCRSCQTGPALYQALRDTILAMSDRRLETERKLASTARRLDELREELGKPFEHEERLTALLGGSAHWLPNWTSTRTRPAPRAWKHPKNRWQPEAAVPAPSHLRWGRFSSWAPGGQPLRTHQASSCRTIIWSKQVR